MPTQQTLIQIDGEHTVYLQVPTSNGAPERWLGPCPGCFLKHRLKTSLRKALRMSETRVTLPLFIHPGCGTYELGVDKTWAKVED